MRNTSIHGTPCLVPVRIQSTDGTSCRGFITRLATLSAAVSSAEVLPRGSRVVLTFRRPSDNQTHEVVGVVVELMEEGGLWRDRPAALIKFDTRVDVDDLSVPRSLRQMRAVKMPMDPDEAPRIEDGTDSPSFSSELGSGVGRRRVRLGTAHRAQPDPRPPQHSTDASQAPLPLAAPSSSRGIAEDPEWLSNDPVDYDADTTAPPQRGFPDDDAPAPPPFDTDDPFRSMPAVDLEDDTAPPIGKDTHEAYARSTGMRTGDATRQATAGDANPFEDPLESIDRWNEISGAFVRPSVSAQNPTARKADRTVAPWESETPAPSLVPRNARVASSLQVSYWARGRKYLSMAQNFSKRGLFLSSSGAAPVRGAIVRIEFPIEGSEEVVRVAFNAEVRWHSADRPQDGLPDGFGVRILGFERPTDRRTYEEFLELILQLDKTSRSQEMQFEWGKPGSLF